MRHSNIVLVGNVFFLSWIGVMLYLGHIPGPLFFLALLAAAAMGGCNAAVLRQVEEHIGALAEHPERLRKDTRLYVEQKLSRFADNVSEAVDRRYANEMLTKQAELSALQSQINPHFLYNTLDSIQGQALRDDNQEIAQMTAALSRFFRYSISMKDSIVTLADELKNVQNYIFIQKYRFGDRFRLEVEYDDPSTLECKVPQMILQPLVENAVYHGLEKTSEQGCVTVKLARTQHRLDIAVIDNGVGIGEEKLAELNARLERPGLLEDAATWKGRSGIALRNVHQRIHLLYGEDYGLHIFSAEGVGTKCVLMLPLQGEVS